VHVSHTSTGKIGNRCAWGRFLVRVSECLISIPSRSDLLEGSKEEAQNGEGGVVGGEGDANASGHHEEGDGHERGLPAELVRQGREERGPKGRPCCQQRLEQVHQGGTLAHQIPLEAGVRVRSCKYTECKQIGIMETLTWMLGFCGQFCLVFTSMMRI